MEFSVALFSIFSNFDRADSVHDFTSPKDGMKRVSFQRLLATSAIAAYLEALGGFNNNAFPGYIKINCAFKLHFCLLPMGY